MSPAFMGNLHSTVLRHMLSSSSFETIKITHQMLCHKRMCDTSSLYNTVRADYNHKTPKLLRLGRAGFQRF